MFIWLTADKRVTMIFLSSIIQKSVSVSASLLKTLENTCINMIGNATKCSYLWVWFVFDSYKSEYMYLCFIQDLD